MSGASAARSAAIVVLAIALAAGPRNTRAAETPHLQFVQEYIRELGEMEDLRAAGEAEFKQSGKSESPFPLMIHYDTRVQLALRADIAMLNGMHLNAPFEDITTQIAGFYQQKIEVHEQMIQIATKMMSAPQPGVDYGALAARMPKLRAVLESIDEVFIKMSVYVFATLIDMKQDKEGHASHLIITRAQRQQLLDELHGEFGQKLQLKGQNSTVAAAGVMSDYLHKDYKCSDDPW